MGKKARTRAKEKRDKEKKSRKAAHKAQYAAWRDAGTNAKSFRAKKRMGVKTVGQVSHPDGPCGNVACMKCSGLFSEDGALRWQLESRNTERAKHGLEAVRV